MNNTGNNGWTSLRILLVNAAVSLVVLGIGTLFINARAEKFKSDLLRQNETSRQRWVMKQEVFRQTLDLADKCLHNIVAYRKVTNIPTSVSLDPVSIDVWETRRIENTLALVCDSLRVLSNLHRIMTWGADTGRYDLALINDLRDAMRAELGFREKINLDPKYAWTVGLPPNPNVEVTRQQGGGDTGK